MTIASQRARWLLAACLPLLLTFSALGQPLFSAKTDPWPTIDATATERPWIPEPGILLNDKGGSPAPDGNRSVAWLRPTERPVKVSDGAAFHLRSSIRRDARLAEWLWTVTGSKYNDDRAAKVAGMFPWQHIVYMEKLSADRPKWARGWAEHRATYWTAWSDGDAPFHYANEMWTLQSILGRTEDPPNYSQEADLLHQIAHSLSYGLDWTTGEIRAEKCHHWTGDAFPPGRNAKSHQWPEVILAMAHLADWDRDDACVQAARLITDYWLRTPPPSSGNWGTRIMGWYLRGLRAIAHFSDDERTAGQAGTLARQLIDEMIADAGGKGWVNVRGYSGPSYYEPWQDWLLLSEMAEWATRWNDPRILVSAKAIADWHLAHTTSARGEVAYTLQVADADTQDPEWFANPTLTTYAIPALRALSQVYRGPYTEAHRKAWNVVCDQAEAGAWDIDNPSWGPAGVKQWRRMPYGLRPDLEPGRGQ